MENHPHTNALIHETSPYLQQHAGNPVDWHPWGKEAIDKAKRENKLIVVSIGYSSCHWCHVMERESFENDEVADLMNSHFVSIKVDREERPDVDRVYMTAVQMMNQQGGWPLNCVTLPDGRPIWGGTYFPKAQWMDVLSQLNTYYREHPERTIQYAEELASGISRNSIFDGDIAEGDPLQTDLPGIVRRWSGYFDGVYGGQKGAPKFPMPVHLGFLLHYGFQHGDGEVLSHVELTLDSLARGGIFDQAGGGFSRYAVDEKWNVPHFEKMLYDNAQLTGLYSEAFQVFGKETYRRIVSHTTEFMKRELLSPEGLFYSALDADSEGAEGKYYTWSREELERVLGNGFSLFADYYRVVPGKAWEENRYVLHREQEPEEFAKHHGLEPDLFLEELEGWHRLLMEARKARTRPGLDTKSLTAWNALAISGLVKAFRAFGNTGDLDLATRVADTILEKCRQSDGMLYRNYAGGRPAIPGFHGDHALFIECCIDLYEATLDQRWLETALELAATTSEKFFHESTGLYLYNATGTETAITNHNEIQDNVIPSSNAVMAHNLFRLGHLASDTTFTERARKMLASILDHFERYPQAHARWGSLILMDQNPFYEIVVAGPEAHPVTLQLMKDYLPHAVLAGSVSENGLPLFKNRFGDDKTRIFVCRDGACQKPVEEIEDAKAAYHIP